MSPPPTDRTVLVFTGRSELDSDYCHAIHAAGHAASALQNDEGWLRTLGGARPMAAVVVLDAEDGRGLVRLRKARTQAPSVAVVAVSAFPDVELLVALIRLGIADFVDHKEGAAGIVAAIQRISQRESEKAGAAAREAPEHVAPVAATPAAGPSRDFTVTRPPAPPSVPPYVSAEQPRSLTADRAPPPVRGIGVLEALAGRRGAALLAKGAAGKDGASVGGVSPSPAGPSAPPLVQKSPDGMPVMDAKLGELQEMMARVDCPVEDVERFVVRDPSLVVAVLKLANSAYFRSPRLVTNIREACVRLGNRQVFALLLESLLRRSFTATSPAARTVFEGMWKNAALTARVARRLAEWQRVGRPEDAYVAALLHNLGEFVLVWKIAEENPPDLGERLAMESDRIATQHESVGALAAQKWGLPPQVQAVAGFHHKGRAHEPPQDVALRTTILACWALSRSVAGDYLPNMAPADPIEFFEQLGLAEQLRVRVAEECLAALEGL